MVKGEMPRSGTARPTSFEEGRTANSAEREWSDDHYRALKALSHIEELKAIVHAGVSLNAQQPSSRQTLLWFAAAGGWADAVEVLLNAGADPNIAREDGRTPLTVAVAVPASGNEPLRAVELLLGGKADVNQPDQRGWSSLHHAAWSASRERASILELLIKAGAKVDAPTNDGRTPLMLAAFIGPDSAAVEVLLQADADVHAHDEAGNTPLHWAMHYGQSAPNLHELSRLLDKGASVNVANKVGWTPLMEAARRAYPTPVGLLFRKSAGREPTDPNLVNNDGWTALMIAVASHRHDVWANWIRAELAITGGDQNHAEATAAIFVEHLGTHGQVGRVWELLSQGANPDIKAKDGTSVHTLLEGREDPSAEAIRKLLELDVAQLVREHKEKLERQREAEGAERKKPATQKPDIDVLHERREKPTKD